MFRRLVSKERFNFTFKLSFLCILLGFACSETENHNKFLPVPSPEETDFEKLCLEKIEETQEAFWYYRLAKVQFEKNQLKNALKNVTLSMQDSVNTLEYAKLRSEILLKMENYRPISFLSELADKEMTVDQASKFAELAIRAGDEPLYLKFLAQIDNQSDKYLYLQALHYYSTGEKRKAIDYLEKAIKQNPTDDELFKMYLKMLSKTGDLVTVNETLRAYTDTNSNFFKKYYGLNLYQLDSFPKAKAFLLQIHAQDSMDVNVNLALSTIYLKQWKYDEAFDHANLALGSVNSGEAHYLIASVYKRQKLYSSAQKHLDLAKNLTGKSENLYNEILMLERNIRYLQARKIMRDSTRKEDSIQ